VGVLVSRHIVQNCLSGHSTYEALHLYDLYGRKLGLDVLFFTVDDIHWRNRRVKGFVYRKDGRFVPREAPLPLVIHNRIKPNLPCQKLSWLQNIPDVVLFNRDNRMDKWQVHQAFHSVPSLQSHLPETHLLTKERVSAMLTKYDAVYVKPRCKSLGIGVRRLAMRDQHLKVKDSKGRVEFMPVAKLGEWVERLQKEGKYLVQQAIPLMRVNERLFDLRVSVQKAGSGEWQVSGMVAKVGRSGGIATNVAVGGEARSLSDVWREAGVEGAEELSRTIERVSLAAARHLGQVNPGIADLGLDIAVDEKEYVWIIEVNARDLRITFRHAQELKAWQRTFAAPMEYAAFLLKKEKSEKKEEPSLAILTPGNLPVSGYGSGSVEIAARSLARELAKHRKVYLFGRRIGPLGRVEAMDIRASTRQSYLDWACRAMVALKPEIVQVENRPLWIESFRRRKIPARYVLFLHSLTYICPPYARPASIGHILGGFDQIVTNSQFMEETLKQKFPHLSSRITSVRLGVDLQHFSPIHDPEVREKRIENRKKNHLNGRPVILFVGRLLPQKGVHVLIEAFEEVRKEHPDAVLLIVGSSFYGRPWETPYVRKLKEKTQEWGETIRWWPFMTHDRLPEIYQMADVLVTPSIGAEAFGLVNVEGMASGLPILTTEAGGIREVVQDRVNGRLLPLDGLKKELVHTLTEWLHDPAGLTEMGRKSREIAEEHFSWERAARELEECYRRLSGSNQ
jgi:glycosyltransferase involved in cell wall biosynthesis/glutathione synthase/RimK-type ligase-like ATP-grasp enzyme